MSWSFGDPIARWFAWENGHDMEGSSTGGASSKVVRVTESNRQMMMLELKLWHHQRCLAVSSRHSVSAHTMTQGKKFGVLRMRCDRKAHVLLHVGADGDQPESV